MIIAVSDAHLGYEKCNKEDFLRFIEMCDLSLSETDHLVLAGDILDFWRRNNTALVMENEEILSKLGSLKTKVHYVAGNHDYYILRLNERYAGNYPFTISRSLRLEDGGNKFYFIHGYELEVMANLEPLSVEAYEEFSEKMCFAEDNFGWFAGHLWDLIENRGGIFMRAREIKKVPSKRKNIDKTYNLATSPAAYVLLGMKPEERLVFGHTHRPFINKNGTVANAGSWVDEGLSKKFQNTYVKISGGKMELKVFNEKNFP